MNAAVDFLTFERPFQAGDVVFIVARPIGSSTVQYTAALVTAVLPHNWLRVRMYNADETVHTVHASNCKHERGVWA